MGITSSRLLLDDLEGLIDLLLIPFLAFILRHAIRTQPKRIPERHWVVRSVRIQVDPTRQPDGILGQKDPIAEP